MNVIVGAQVDRQFVHQLDVEVSLGQHVGRHLAQQFQRALDDRAIRAVDDARAAQKEGQGPEPLVRIQIHLLSVLQDGDRTVADEVVQSVQRAGHDPIRLVPRRALFEYRLENLRQKERLLKVLVLQMEQQIPVMFVVGGQGAVERQRNHLLGLRTITKGR